MLWNTSKIPRVIEILNRLHHVIPWWQSSFPRQKLSYPYCLGLKEREPYNLHHIHIITHILKWKGEKKPISNTYKWINVEIGIGYKILDLYLSRNTHERERRCKRRRECMLIQRTHSVIIHSYYPFGVKKWERIWIPTHSTPLLLL